MDIIEAPLTDERLRALIDAHKAFCLEHTPTGCGYALTSETAGLEDIRFWLAVDDGQAVGCIGLKPAGPGHAEVKTLHVRAVARGEGIGAALVRHVIATARAQRMARLSLETGSSEGFAASRRLYERMGFDPCAPFGAYASDPFSYCMTMAL